MRPGTASLHLFAEGKNLPEVFFKLGLGDEGALCPVGSKRRPGYKGI